MKKTISLILALILTCALFIDAFAATYCPGAHNYGPTTTSTYYDYGGGQTCIKTIKTTKECQNCPYEYKNEVEYPTSHSYGIYYASCTGTQQTIKTRCLNCEDSRTLSSTTQTCPGGPHTGSCRWLPV